MSINAFATSGMPHTLSGVNHLLHAKVAQLPASDVSAAKPTGIPKEQERDIGLLDSWLKANPGKEISYKVESDVYDERKLSNVMFDVLVTRPSGANSLRVSISHGDSYLKQTAEFTKIGNSQTTFQTDSENLPVALAADLLHRATVDVTQRTGLFTAGGVYSEVALVDKWINRINDYPKGSIQLPSGEVFTFETGRQRHGGTQLRIWNKTKEGRGVSFHNEHGGIGGDVVSIVGLNAGEVKQLLEGFAIQYKKAAGLR
jgi:hypothetical protein